MCCVRSTFVFKTHNFETLPTFRGTKQSLLVECNLFNVWTATHGLTPHHCRGFENTLRHTRVCRTALDGWASPHNNNTHKRRISMCLGVIRTCNQRKRVAADSRVIRATNDIDVFNFHTAIQSLWRIAEHGEWMGSMQEIWLSYCIVRSEWSESVGYCIRDRCQCCVHQ